MAASRLPSTSRRSAADTDETWVAAAPSYRMNQPRPTVSVILVSDYAAGGDKGWDDLRATLSALARQNSSEPVEFILSENEEFAESIPADLLQVLPSLRVVSSTHTGSYALKNHGVSQASADIIVILDADCSPASDWLANLISAFKAHPEASAISGRTTYEGATFMERVLALLSRSYVDPGHAGITRFVSNNNAGWKRDVYAANPLPTDSGPFAARMQSEAVLRSGGVLRFDPSIRTVHEFEGLAMELDIRRNTGFGTVITRLRDPRLPWARLIRLGRLSIPFIVAGKTWNSWGDAIRCWRLYGLRPHELPVALVLAPVLIVLEIPGMWAAYGNRAIVASAYR